MTMLYSLGHDVMFTVLALISAIALLSMHGVLATVFFVLAIVYILMEHRISEYIRTL
jgi:hypothetical protein